MRKYFYISESLRFGPVSHEELRKANITADTLVWFETLTEWKAAREIPELADFFVNPAADDKTFSDSESLPTIPEVPNGESIQTPEYIKSPEVAATIPSFDQTAQTAQRPGMFASPFGFDGRIRRTEYWLTYVIVYVVMFLIIAMMGYRLDANPGILLLMYIPILWLFIAQNAKRCHDRGNSGWYQLIPFYGLWMAFGPGDPHLNEYGPSPKG